MPVIYQHQINEFTSLAIWKIEEPEDFFRAKVYLHNDVSHPHKRLQHLAGRYLLQYIVPGFPYELIAIAETRKPYMPGEEYYFSLSHCRDYAAAIVSTENKTGIDLEMRSPKIEIVHSKFLSASEKMQLQATQAGLDFLSLATIVWSAKEAIYKWAGETGVGFKEHIRYDWLFPELQIVRMKYAHVEDPLLVKYEFFGDLCLCYLVC